MELKLPWPPSPNSYYGHTKYGAFYIKKKGELYRVAVYRAVRRQVGRIYLDRPLAVFITFNPPSKVLEPWDMDNFKKAMFDSLTVCRFWKDDSLVHRDYSEKGTRGGRGSVQMIVEVI